MLSTNTHHSPRRARYNFSCTPLGTKIYKGLCGAMIVVAALDCKHFSQHDISTQTQGKKKFIDMLFCRWRVLFMRSGFIFVRCDAIRLASQGALDFRSCLIVHHSALYLYHDLHKSMQCLEGVTVSLLDIQNTYIL